MARVGLFIGEIARRSGVSRKALRIYEAAGILAPPRRTPSGYRLYTADALTVLSFVRQARRLGFTLAEIERIVRIRRQGGPTCSHVRELVSRKLRQMDEQLRDLTQARDGLQRVLDDWRPSKECDSAICPQIERRTRHGPPEDVAVPLVHGVPGGRGRRRRT